MKSVLLSIQPKWCKLIFSGEKTIEVRKTAPKLETPFKVYVYQTKHKGKSIVSEALNTVYGGGKVIGEFVCDEIYVRPANVIYYGKGQEDYLDLLKSACMTEREVLDYMGGQFNRDTYFWHITNLKIYDKPKELGEFCVPCKEYDSDKPHCGECDYYRYSPNDSGDAQEECLCDGYKPLRRPPMSWQYVEDHKEEIT